MAVTLPRDRVRAPELLGGAGWLNTDAPLTLASLRGKVVILDFWTYCCINCMHVLPDLKRLEDKLKVIDPVSGQASTPTGRGRPGLADGRPGALNEPGGLSAAQGRLWVADTNNHAVRVFDLGTGHLSSRVLSGL